MITLSNINPMVPRHFANKFSKKCRDNGLPVGVLKRGAKWIAQGVKIGGSQHLGTYPTAEAAELVVKINYEERLTVTLEQVLTEREETRLRIIELKTKLGDL